MSDDEAIERMLKRYRPADAGEELRQRVLALRPARDGFYWEALAASVLVGLCLIQVIGSAAAVQPLVRIEATNIPGDIAKGFTEEELGAARFALAGSAAIRGLPQPEGGTSWDRY